LRSSEHFSFCTIFFWNIPVKNKRRAFRGDSADIQENFWIYQKIFVQLGGNAPKGCGAEWGFRGACPAPADIFGKPAKTKHFVCKAKCFLCSRACFTHARRVPYDAVKYALQKLLYKEFSQKYSVKSISFE